MMKRNYKLKKTISMKQFLTEFGADFSDHMKQRLLELGERCILNRQNESNILDLRHIEHIKYDCACSTEDNTTPCKKEYAFGQLLVKDGQLHFSNTCLENEDIMQIPTVDNIYAKLGSEEITIEDRIQSKKIDDTNIDFVIDSLLQVCPEMSAEHRAILAKYN